MKNLIIPCAGDLNSNDIPKYISKHPDGKTVIEKCIDGIAFQEYDRIIIVVLEEHVKKYKVDEIIQKVLNKKYPFDLVIIPNKTNGPADTVYQAVEKAHVQGELHIKDSDNYLETQVISGLNFIAGLNLIEYKHDVHNLYKKSFLILNEQNQVLDIVEKKIRSDIICAGLYGFTSSKDFMFAYERLSGNEYPMQTLYVSHLISYLIGYSGKVFHYLPVDKFESWDGSKEWNDVQNAYATYFLNLDTVNVDEKNTLSALKNLSRHGARFVGFTSAECKEYDYEEKLNQKGIRCMCVAYGCTDSNVKKIIQNKKDLIKYDARI